MRYSLPIFSAAVIVAAIIIGQGMQAQPAGAKQVAPQRSRQVVEAEIGGAEAEALVENALAMLETRSSITARVRCRADLHGHSMIGAGTYVQGLARAGLLRWEMKLQIDDQTISLQQIADGRSLWTKRDIDGTAAIERVDLMQLVEDDVQRMPVTHMPLAGGLPEMLGGLRRAFEFSVALPVRLGNRQVYAVRGDWRPTALARLMSDQRAAIEAGQPADLSRLPPEVPDHVVVFLGQDDLFPYRIDYRRQRSRSSTSNEAVTLLTLEWLDVRFDERPNPAMFVFDPGDADIEERTLRFVETIRQWP